MNVRRRVRVFPRGRAGKIGLLLLGGVCFLQGAGIVSILPQPFETVSVLRAQSEQSQYESAYNLYLQAAALSPSTPAPQKTQSWNNVIDAFNQFISNYPKSVKRDDAELFLGYAYLMRSGYVDARDGATGREHLNYVIQQGKKKKNEDAYRKALLQYAYSYFSLLDYRNAMPNLEKFIAEFPNSEDLQYAYYYAGVSESNLGHYAKAQEYFQTCLSRFPNGARKNVCLIEQAAADGRAGNYERADQEFYRLSMDSTYPYAKRASIQRAYLKVLQEDYNGALSLMDQFVRSNENDSANKDLIEEALGYEAFCYLRLNRYQEGLDAIAKIEQMVTSLTPQTAFLKIQLLTKMGRFDEANALLRQIQNSVMSLANSDIIPYYDSTIRLGEGDYDNAIREVLGFAEIYPSQSNQNQYETRYFDRNSNSSATKLTPQDYINACGNLVIGYASRYAQYGDARDNTNQEAVFQMMYQYANSQTDPVLMKIIQRVDRERRDALVKPVGASFAGGGSQDRLSDSGRNQANNNPGSSNGNQANSNTGNAGGNQPNGNSGNNGGTWEGNPLSPSSGQIAQDQNTGRRIPPRNPYGPGGLRPTISGQDSYPSDPNAPSTGNGAQAASAGSQNANTAETPAPALTEEDAKEMLRKATESYEGNHLDDANDELLNLLTSSETLWTDFPRIASAAALLRANILFELKQYDEGQTVCDMLIKMAPNSPEAVDACYYCGYRADYYGKNAKAIEYLQTAVNSAHDGHYLPECYYLLAWNEWERKNTDQAEKYFSKIFRDYQNSRYWSNAAWAYAEIKYQNREYVAAEKIVNDALATGPDEAIIDRLLLLKGEIALKNRDFVKARIAYQTILREYPQSSCRRTALSRMQNVEELCEDYEDDPASIEASAKTGS